MAEVRDFLMPDLGEGLTEAEVLNWLVAVDDVVTVDQPIAEVSTEKAVVEVPTPFAGRVVTLHGAAGDMITVGSPLISIEVGTAAAAPDGASGNVLVGYGTNEEPEVRRHRIPSAVPAAAAAPAAAAPPASPVVRRLAAERGVDLSTVTGTGPGGMVTRADLDAIGESSPAPATGASPAQNGTTRRRLTGIDRVAAERLAKSHREIPTATAVTTADATALLARRADMEAADDGVHVTPFALVLRVCVEALRTFPRLNAHFDTDGNEAVLYDAVHLGVAVQTDSGLVVPVIRDANDKTTRQLAAELARLATTARSGALSAAELSGSTFTVSNFGAFGVDGGTALINPPEVAILGVGRFAQRPWVVEGRLEPRTVVELSLVFDHRAADGAVGGGFLRHVADLIERPGALHDD